MADSQDRLQMLLAAISAQQQLNQALLQEIRSLNAMQAENQWVSLEEAAKALGPAFSFRKLLEDIKAGFLKYERDFIDTSNGNRPTYAVKVVALRKVYEVPPEKRCRFQG